MTTNIVWRATLLALLVSSSGFAAETDSGAADDSGDDSLAESQTKLKTEKHDDDAPPAKKAAPTEPKEPDREVGADATYGHGLQIGLRAGVAFGYRMVIRYDKSPLCKMYDHSKSANDQQKICGFGASPGTEVALSFAPFDSVEPYIFGRFGFSGESTTNTKPLTMFGIGARIYTMSDSRFKIFVEPALAYETEGGAGAAEWQSSTFQANYKKDLVFHAGVGPQYDFAKAFGIFLNGAVDVGILRAISATMLLNVGIQLRFP